MPTRSRALAAFVLTAAVLSLSSFTLFADPPIARRVAPGTGRIVDTCATAPAAAAHTLAPDAWHVGSSSPDTSYDTGTCARWIVDITVGELANLQTGGDQNAAHRVRLTPGIPVPYMGTSGAGLNQETCPTASLEVKLYRKDSGQRVFNYIGGGTLVGTWSFHGPAGPAGPGRCTMEPAAGYQDPGDQMPPAAGTTSIYRLALRGHYQGQIYRVSGSLRRPIAEAALQATPAAGRKIGIGRSN
jgi:hypothetical protein